MKIMFDLQKYLRDKPVGELIGDKVLRPYGKTLPTLLLEQVEDARVVRVTNQTSSDSGIEIQLCSIDDICGGDRVIVVGRFGQSLTLQGTRITMFSGEKRDVELSYYEPFNNLYSLCCILEDVVYQKLYVSASKTSMSFFGLDFFVDGILVVREKD